MRLGRFQLPGWKQTVLDEIEGLDEKLKREVDQAMHRAVRMFFLRFALVALLLTGASWVLSVACGWAGGKLHFIVGAWLGIAWALTLAVYLTGGWDV